MNIFKVTVIIYVIAAFEFMYGCGPSSRATKSYRTDPYSENMIHPKVVVYNFSNDSSLAFIKIYTSELLYKKDSATFNSNVRVNLYVFSGFDSGQFSDSTSIRFSEEKIDDDKSRYIIARLLFKKPILPQYLLKFEVMDLNRGMMATKFISCSSNDDQDEFSFMMMPAGSDFPAFDKYITSRDSFHIITRAGQPSNIFVRYFKKKLTLASPPFSNNPAQRFSYIADSSYVTQLNDSTIFNFTEEGIYHFQFDTLKKSGFTLFKFDDDFPKVTNAGQMIGPLRYLTTIEEYNNIIASPNTGEAIEKFWLDRSSDKDRARKLISAFYGRIEETNKNFTSYSEGWRTDRGIIYLIFGKPDVVEKNDKTETWRYMGVAGANMLIFDFSKINNPFTENDFILIRSQRFEFPWFRAVDVWRQGRVFGYN